MITGLSCSVFSFSEWCDWTHGLLGSTHTLTAQRSHWSPFAFPGQCFYESKRKPFFDSEAVSLNHEGFAGLFKVLHCKCSAELNHSGFNNMTCVMWMTERRVQGHYRLWLRTVSYYNSIASFTTNSTVQYTSKNNECDSTVCVNSYWYCTVQYITVDLVFSSSVVACVNIVQQ